MNKLTIFEQNGNLWTDSRDVAAMVNKRHDHLVRDIRGYIAVMAKPTAPKNGESASEPKIGPSDFFVESTYTDVTGRTLPCFLISKKGCEFIANKLTGEKGVQFTAAYVTQFNAMEQREQAPKALSAMQQLRLQSQALLELDERTSVIEEKIERVEDKVDNQITLDHGQQRTLQAVISKRVYERAATIYPAAEVKDRVKALFAALYRDIKNRFGVASYRDIRTVDYPPALKYVEAWVEPAELRSPDRYGEE